jgi:long-chain acyl-CoA synthetase
MGRPGVTSTSVGSDDAVIERAPSLLDLLTELPCLPDDRVVSSDSGDLTRSELEARVAALAQALAQAGVEPGAPVANLVEPGPSAVVVMLAIWQVGGVYVPINRRNTAPEVAELLAETPVVLVVGAPADLDMHQLAVGAVGYDYQSASSEVRAKVAADGPRYEADVAFVLRTSGTTGRPKAVLIGHSGTIDALDASLFKLRRGADAAEPRRPYRLNLIPVSLALWAGIFTTLFSFRAGFGVALLETFTTNGFLRAVKAHGVTSTILAPAMITMLTDDESIPDLQPLHLVRSITAPLSPEVARRFYRRFGVFVLNSYGQTELGGEVVGWSAQDVRAFGEAKLGAVGRPYAHVDLRIRRDDGTDAGPGELGEVVVNSPYRMRGYASADGAGGDDAENERLVDGYLRTGDLGRVDADGFLWIEGRVSDMINRGGMKVFPDEIEEVLRQFPAISDAAVAALPDRRLGEVPHAWYVATAEIDSAELAEWCRRQLAPYKVPVGFTSVASLPRSDVGKLLRRDLVAGHNEATD